MGDILGGTRVRLHVGWDIFKGKIIHVLVGPSSELVVVMCLLVYCWGAKASFVCNVLPVTLCL